MQSYQNEYLAYQTGIKINHMNNWQIIMLLRDKCIKYRAIQCYLVQLFYGLGGQVE